MTDDPVEFLRQAHARAEKVAKAMPPGPWAWTRYSDPNWCHTLEGPDGFTEAVLKSATPSPGVSWIELHPAFDEFVPEPAAVLRRIAADRKQLELHAAVPDHGRFSERGCEASGCDGAHEEPPVCRSCRNYAGDPVEAPCATVEILAEGWGWTPNA